MLLSQFIKIAHRKIPKKPIIKEDEIIKAASFSLYKKETSPARKITKLSKTRIIPWKYDITLKLIILLLR